MDCLHCEAKMEYIQEDSSVGIFLSTYYCEAYQSSFNEEGEEL